MLAFTSKLASLCNTPNDVIIFKYQLRGEDLDTLNSVTNDEDLDHMMIEYAKPARLRLFLFPLNNNPPISLGSNDTKSEHQWFVDTMNSVKSGLPMVLLRLLRSLHRQRTPIGSCQCG
ncbi:hypothetical protein CerSpe_175350 [Prunus speciosa]